MSDWATKHGTDEKIEMAATKELLEYFDLHGDEFDVAAEDLPIHRTALQQLSMQQSLFAVMFPVPCFMGLTHGGGIGGIIGTFYALIPNAGFNVTTGCLGGVLIGTSLVTCTIAVVLAVFPFPQDIRLAPMNIQQRLLLLLSPVLAIPAIVEAVILWTHWYVAVRGKTNRSG
jgi:hypothetical protein